jgi:hypothetical protein
VKYRRRLKNGVPNGQDVANARPVEGGGLIQLTLFLAVKVLRFCRFEEFVQPRLQSTRATLSYSQCGKFCASVWNWERID